MQVLFTGEIRIEADLLGGAGQGLGSARSCWIPLEITILFV